MGKILVPHIANGNGDLDRNIPSINAAVRDVEKFLQAHFQIRWKIDVIFSRGLYRMAIPEDGVGGRTLTSGFIELAIGENANPPRGIIAEMLAHEAGHAVRWGVNPQRSDSFIRNAIFEGIAICIQEEFAKKAKNTTFFLDIIRKRQNDCAYYLEIGRKTHEFWENTEYDYNLLFLDGGKLENGKSLPRWTGYKLGYYAVKEAMQQTSKTIFELYAQDFDFFIKYI